MSNFRVVATVAAFVAAFAYMFGTNASSAKLDRIRYDFFEKMSEHKLYEVQRFGQCQALMNHMAWQLAGEGRNEEANAYFKLISNYEQVGILVGAALGFDRGYSVKVMKDGWEWFDLLYPEWDNAIQEGHPALCAQALEDRTASLSAAGVTVN